MGPSDFGRGVDWSCPICSHIGGEAVQRVANVGPHHAWGRHQQRAHAAFYAQVTAVSNAADRGASIRKPTRRFFGDADARLSAALRVLGEQPCKDASFRLRNEVNLYCAGYPLVAWYAKPKSHGGSRPICRLPPALKAAHYMIGAVIQAVLPANEALYGVRGRGVDKAVLKLKSLQNDGFVHLASTDIVDCFQSIDPDSLYQLPLPMEVIRRTLDHRYMSFTEYRDHSVYGCMHKASGPSGLLQGSPASSVILAWLLRDIPTSEDARVMLCFDNIVVAARTTAASRGMMETLTAYFRQSPAGPLALCYPTFADGTSLEFMGALLDPQRRDIGIAHATLSRLEIRLGLVEEADQRMLDGIGKRHQVAASANSIARAINPFRGNYPIEVWRCLMDFRSGLPFLDADCPELQRFIEVSAESVDRRNDGYISHLHRNLFAPSGTKEAALIRKILARSPRLKAMIGRNEDSIDPN